MRLEAKHDEYQGVEPVEIVYPPESLAQANTSGDTRVFGTETAADPPAAPGNDQAPSGPERTLAISRIDDSKLVTIAPPTPQALSVALPPARHAPRRSGPWWSRCRRLRTQRGRAPCRDRV